MIIRLNLSTKPLETHRSFLAGAALIAFIAIGALIPLSWHVYKVRESDAQMREAAEKTRREFLLYQQQRSQLEQFFTRRENAQLSERAAFINSILDARSFNWTQMFMDLEKIMPPGVRVVSIDPVQKNGGIEVKMNVGAVSDEAMLKFLRSLGESKAFTHVTPASERAPAQAASVDRVIMELTVIYETS
jgi:type IV pilus assembly protein PilN